MKGIVKNEQTLQYFGEIMKEFFDNGTPVFYRVHISNVKTLLQEIIDYEDYTKNTKDFNNNYVLRLIEELFYAMNKDIIFKTCYCIRFKFFKDYIENNKSSQTIKIKELLNRIKPILQDLNKNYLKDTRTELLKILSKDNFEPKHFIELKKISFSLSTEIFRMGYSKHYIYDKVHKYLLCKDASITNIETFLDLFNSKKRKFMITFKIYSYKKEVLNILDAKPLQDTSEVLLNTTKQHVRTAFNKFRQTKYNHGFVKKEMTAIDYESALHLAVKGMYKEFDLLKFEYPRDSFSLASKKALVFDTENAEYFFPTITIQLDGYKKPTSPEVFFQKKENINKILQSDYLDKSTKRKIETSLKFYRYFQESDTLEHKFLNLWIGLENMFSLSGDHGAWQNINSIFPKIHSLSHIDTLLTDLLKVQYIQKTKEEEREESVNALERYISCNNLYKTSNFYECLKINDKFLNIRNLEVVKNDNLFYGKLHRLKHRIVKPKEFIKSHKNQVTWDLFRMYRIRNMIIHQGVSSPYNIPLEALVSTLENYYLHIFEILIAKLSTNDRFQNIEQLFESCMRTYDFLVSDKNKISDETNPEKIRLKILKPTLLF